MPPARAEAALNIKNAVVDKAVLIPKDRAPLNRLLHPDAWKSSY
jgi:hypothetical protein